MKTQVQPFFHAGSNTFSYVVSDPNSGHAAIIDPVLDFDAASARTGTTSAQAIVDHVRAHGLAVQWILAAHWLKECFPSARLAIGEGIRTVQATFAPVLDLGDGFRPDGAQFDHLFTDGEAFGIGALPARVIAVPGHTSDSNAFLVGDALFPGDSLFMPDGGTARCDFPGGDAATLFRSIRRLFELPDATRVFVCHDYGPNGREIACETSIGEQRARNIHVHDGIDETTFVALRTARDVTLGLPALILPSLQVNLRGGALPQPDANGVRYLKLPLDRF
jgi:glyoxylase-like metal-dependent hydrolase (beta-lactamase superfamily II)